MRKFLRSAWLDSSWKREAPWHARAQLGSSQWLLSASEYLLSLSPNLSGHLPAGADLCSSHIPHRGCQAKHPAGTFTSRPFLSCLTRTKGTHSFHICCPAVFVCKFSLFFCNNKSGINEWLWLFIMCKIINSLLTLTCQGGNQSRRILLAHLPNWKNLQRQACLSFMG